MNLEYYVKNHLGTDRMYVANNMKRMWLMKLTKRSTITDPDKKALEGLGFKLVKVNNPER